MTATPASTVPALQGATLELEASYVPGFPALVAMTIEGDPDGAIAELRRPTLQGSASLCGVELVDASGAVRTRAPHLGGGSGLQPPCFDLGAAEARRFVFDLHDVVSPSAPGEYRLTLTYAGGHAGRRTATSRPATMTIREAQPHERAALDRLGPVRDAYADWWGWAFRAPRTAADGPPFALDPNDPLRLHRLLRFVRFNPGELAALDAFAYSFAGARAPDAVLVRAELMRRMGSFDTLAQLVEFGTRSYRGLGPDLLEIQRGVHELCAYLAPAGAAAGTPRPA